MIVKTFQPTAGQNRIRVAPWSAVTGCPAEVQQPKPEPDVAEGNCNASPLRNTRLWSKIPCTFSQALCRTSKRKFSMPTATISCYQTLLGQNYSSPQSNLTGELQKVYSSFYAAHRAQLIILLRSGYCYLWAALSLGSVVSNELGKGAEGSSIGKDKHLTGPVALWISKKGKWRLEHESPSPGGGFTAEVLVYSSWHRRGKSSYLGISFTSALQVINMTEAFTRIFLQTSRFLLTWIHPLTCPAVHLLGEAGSKEEQLNLIRTPLGVFTELAPRTTTVAQTHCLDQKRPPWDLLQQDCAIPDEPHMLTHTLC